MDGILTMCIALFGGLGLFLFGMTMMGEGLKTASGDKLKTIFSKTTSRPILGIGTGAIITTIIQSSSATTVMVVGFVNASLMNLRQATYVIMGSNIGTTITGHIISLNIDAVVPLIIGVGALIGLFAKGKKHKEIGNIIFGLGILFLGMSLMKDAMGPLGSSEIFNRFMGTLDGNIFLGVFTGFVMTAIIQSSSASTGILIALASTGVLNMNIVMPILFGCNIGTCVTALISSIGTNRNAKKAAVIHLLIKIIGTIIFIPLIGVLNNIVYAITPEGAELVKRQIAVANSVFNIANTIVLVPFTGLLIKLANRIIPGEDVVEKFGTKYIDDRLIETPAIAGGLAKREIIRMAEITKGNLINSKTAFIEQNHEKIDKVYEAEKLINLLETEITSFVIEISKSGITDDNRENLNHMFHIINDIERIGDHCKNIVELANEEILYGIKFSTDALKELEEMFSMVLDAVERSIDAYENGNIQAATEVIEIEGKIDFIEKRLRTNHINRLNDGKCNATGGAIYLDLISNLERIGDHANNIAQIAFEEDIEE